MPQVNRVNFVEMTNCHQCLHEKNIRHIHYFDQIYYYQDKEPVPTKLTGCLCTHEILLHEKENKIAET